MRNEGTEVLYLIETKNKVPLPIQFTAYDYNCFETVLNEAYLFHGSRKNNPFLIASSEVGFNLGKSDSLYYKGIYFALRSRYSHAYAYRSSDLEGKQPCKSGLYFHLIVALVVRGAIKYESDAWQSNDKSLPADAGQRALGDQYDSVEGGPHRPHRRGPGDNDSLVSVVYR